MERPDLADLVSDTVASTGSLARKRGVWMTGDVEGSVRVEGDVRELSRVLTNLVLNGIIHTPAHGAVVISAGTDRAAAWVTVTDSCGGIPEPDLSRVFEPWWRRPPRALRAARALGWASPSSVVSSRPTGAASLSTTWTAAAASPYACGARRPDAERQQEVPQRSRGRPALRRNPPGPCHVSGHGYGCGRADEEDLCAQPSSTVHETSVSRTCPTPASTVRAMPSCAWWPRACAGRTCGPTGA